MTLLRYCRTCFYPHTKPDLTFNSDGVCSACTAFEARKTTNWGDLERQWEQTCEYAKYVAKDLEYDCVIPVSGGKDSHYQVHLAMRYGLRPLLVCAQTDDISDIGRDNLANIAKYAKLKLVTTDSKVRRKINKFTLQTIGDISWAEHITIFTIPFREAMEHNIPLIIWGENPQNEYGGPMGNQTDKYLDVKWLQEFGGLNGLRVSDLESMGVASHDELKLYRQPTFCADIKSVFLGAYFPWDGWRNANIAADMGFKTYDKEVEGSGVNYENLDNYQTGVHDYFKYLKFGFGRATDLANNQLRRGRMSRDEAKSHIIRWDGQYPSVYLGKNLAAILKDIDMSNDEWVECIKKFANKKLFDVVAFPPMPWFTETLKDA